MSSVGIILIITAVLLGLFYNYVNGFNDTANFIATSIVTKSLSPLNALILASVFELLGSLVSTRVAETIGKNIVNAGILSLNLIISALLAAILWNLVTWYFGIPSSSSHALIGSLVGTALIKSWSLSAIHWHSLLTTVILPLFLSPVIGLLGGSIIMVILLWILRPFKPKIINKFFSKFQIITAVLMAFSYGTNDAQKSMGIITLALLSGGLLPHFYVPIWVTFLCALTLAAGAATGGWKIIKTLGNNISKLNPVSGFAAQAATIGVINSATFLIGAPVSTTHIISSSIMGVGATKRISAVHWGVAKDLIYTWMITIPSCAILGGVIFRIMELL